MLLRKIADGSLRATFLAELDTAYADASKARPWNGMAPEEARTWGEHQDLVDVLSRLKASSDQSILESFVAEAPRTFLDACHFHISATNAPKKPSSKHFPHLVSCPFWCPSWRDHQQDHLFLAALVVQFAPPDEFSMEDGAAQRGRHGGYCCPCLCRGCKV